MVEDKLPQPILDKATRSGNEYAWPLADVPEVIGAAEALGLANLGGQPQFIYSDGTCEPYWIDVGSDDQRKGETWAAYVRRSAAEVRAGFKRVRNETDFEAEARQFQFLIDKLDRGESIIPHLRFVLYFVANEMNEPG